MSDQWIEPFVIEDDRGQPVGPIGDGDALVLFNFRADRMVEISKAFEYEKFPHFDRQRRPQVRVTLACGALHYTATHRTAVHLPRDRRILRRGTDLD